MKMYTGVKVYLHAFFTSTLDGMSVHIISPSVKNSDKDPSNHSIGGWMGLTNKPYFVKKTKNLCFRWESKSDFPVPYYFQSKEHFLIMQEAISKYLIQNSL